MANRGPCVVYLEGVPYVQTSYGPFPVSRIEEIQLESGATDNFATPLPPKQCRASSRQCPVPQEPVPGNVSFDGERYLNVQSRAFGSRRAPSCPERARRSRARSDAGSPLVSDGDEETPLSTKARKFLRQQPSNDIDFTQSGSLTDDSEEEERLVRSGRGLAPRNRRHSNRYLSDDSVDSSTDSSRTRSRNRNRSRRSRRSSHAVYPRNE